MRPLTRRVIGDDGRLFGAWAKRDDPAHSWFWSRDQVHDGAPQRATEAGVPGVFARLAGETPT